MGRVIGRAGTAGLLAALMWATGCRKPPPPPPPPPDPKVETAAKAAAANDAAPKYKAFWEEWSDEKTPPPDWIEKSAYILNTTAVPRIDPSPKLRGTAPTWKELSGLLGAHEKEIGEILAITRVKRCDFELSSDIGEATEKTWNICERLVNLWTVLRSDAGRKWQAGDMNGCVERLGAMYGMVDHCAQQQDMVMSVMGGAMLVWTGEAVKTFMEQSPAGAFTAEHARAIKKEMGRLKADDPVRWRYAQLGERAHIPELAGIYDRIKDRIGGEWNQIRELVDKRAK